MEDNYIEEGDFDKGFEKKSVKLSPDLEPRKTANRGIFPLFTLLIILFFIIPLIFSGISYLFSKFPSFSFTSKTSLTNKNRIISSNTNYALTLEVVDGKEIYTIKKDIYNFQQLPIDSKSVKAISFAYDSKKVAFISSGQFFDLIKIEFPKISPVTRFSLFQMSQNELINLLLKRKTFCPWTDLKWSIDNQKIAFFVCDEQSSYLTIASMEPTVNIIWCGEENKTLKKRNLDWSGSEELFISNLIPHSFIKKINISEKIESIRKNSL